MTDSMTRLEQVLKSELTALRHDFYSHMSTLCSKFDSITGEQREQRIIINRHARRLDMLEQQLVDLNRSRRNNLPLLGLPGRPKLNKPIVSTQTFHPNAKKPRVFIFKLLCYSDRYLIFREARNHGPLHSRDAATLKVNLNGQITFLKSSDEARKFRDSLPQVRCSGSPGKISRIQKSEEAGDENKNEETSKEVEKDAAEQTHEDIDMSSEDEGETCETIVRTEKPVIEEESVTLKVGYRETEEVQTCLQRKRNVHQRPQGSVKPIGDSHASSREPSRASTSFYSSPLENRQDVLTVRSSIKQYWDKREEKDRAPGSRHQGGDMYSYLKHLTTRVQETNHIPVKQQPSYRNPELKKRLITQASPASTSRAYASYGCSLLKWILLLLPSLALGLLGYHLFATSFATKSAEHNLEALSLAFEAQLAALKPLFPNQHPELWKRTEIHIKRHLGQTHPSQPVSLILTSGNGAVRTLGCLAQKIAAAFSTASNTSVLDFDGTSEREQDSDQVKLNIDKALKKAFDGGKHAAIIHRFEELPPASTLIFYRYCDHENAAFKNVFLTFTILLPVTEIDSNLRLSEIEEQVHEFVKDKFVSKDKSARFNEMDTDKLSGLWSRISHLVLPVAAEQTIEQQGCGG